MNKTTKTEAEICAALLSEIRKLNASTAATMAELDSRGVLASAVAEAAHARYAVCVATAPDGTLRTWTGGRGPGGCRTLSVGDVRVVAMSFEACGRGPTAWEFGLRLREAGSVLAVEERYNTPEESFSGI